ncbi:cytochrome P450 [Streptomyces sp. NPDC051217]|uniref:cytochrome P450 n=1 Tax=Streptomyces sp. NPDC051217 TaxID=3365644 RepID=UPI0037B16F17
MTPATVPSSSEVAGPMDLGDPDLYSHGDPVAAWRLLRAERRPYWNERSDGTGFWAVLTHRDALAVYQDPALFTSERGMRLDLDQAANDAAAGRMLIVTDPPRHHQIRVVLGSAFTPRTVARLEASVRDIVAADLDAAIDAGTVDFAETAARLPVSVICDLLGVPEKDREFMLAQTGLAFGSEGTADPYSAAAAHADLMDYYGDLVAYRRRAPGDDLVTAMVEARVNGEPLTDEEIFLNCDGLISGGNETARHAAAGGVLALANHPDQLRRLADDPGILRTAVGEILRWTSPALHVMRTATVGTNLAGQQIRAGHRIVVFNAAANRDDEVFEEPDRFDLGRSPNRHLAFGNGTHHCLGSALAALQLTVLFGEIARRVAAIEPAGPARRLRSNLIWGYTSAPIRLTARR